MDESEDDAVSRAVAELIGGRQVQRTVRKARAVRRPEVRLAGAKFPCVTVTLTGRTGSGKTCLARWISEMLGARGIRVETFYERAGGDMVIVELERPYELPMESMEELRRARR